VRFSDVEPRLLERCRSGDVDAFDELCGLIQHDLYTLLYAILRNHDDSDDALQECLVRTFRHLPQLESLDKFPGWMTRMAVNQCKTLLARRRNRAFVPLAEEIEIPNDSVVAAGQAPASPRHSLESKEIAAHIGAAIRTLPHRQRAAITLYEIEQHSVAEVAAILGCSEGAVKFNLHEARKKLHDRLKEYLPIRRGAEA
jgi:RNA polymerase sigma factor (sigma-70 family)